MMSSERNATHRRAFLRGAGVTMALPWLESMTALGAVKADSKSPYPKRFAALFMANGVNPLHWWGKETANGLELGKSLESLEPIRSKVNVIHGLFNKNATGVGIHPGQTGNILSGVSLKKGAVIRGGISVDQVLAREFEEETIQPSLVLGCEQPITGYHETNFSMAYSSHISWRDVTAPVPMEVYPSLAFDSLFDNRGSRRTQSVLDRVRTQAAGLRRQASYIDRAKLDEYLTSVREIERRIERVRQLKDKADDSAKKANSPLVSMPRPDDGLPEDIREHMRLMCDVIALAFQTDKTRVATLLLCRDISGLFYPFLNVRLNHHTSSHHDQSDDYERVSTYYCDQLGYLAKKLDAMSEGDGTVLDHSCLLFVNNMWSGSAHDSTKVPLIQVGGLDGAIKTGRALDYLKRGDENRKLCSLYLSILDGMGVKGNHFGDADKCLEGF